MDELAGIDWLTFLTNADEPTEPVEFGVQTWGVHNTTETLEVDVLIDAGADGVFADADLQADYLVAKLPGPGGQVCVFDLSLPDPFDDCAALYFADYSNFNSNLVGLVVDAAAIGLTDNAPELAYHVEACTGTFSGDVPGLICDSAGEIDDGTGTWNLTFERDRSRPGDRPARLQGVLGRRRLRRHHADHGRRRIRGAGRQPVDPGPVPERPAAPHGHGRRDDDVATEGGGPGTAFGRSRARRPSSGGLSGFSGVTERASARATRDAGRGAL